MCVIKIIDYAFKIILECNWIWYDYETIIDMP